MPRGMPVDYDDIWNEVSSPEFQGAEPTNEYDVNTIRELKLLLREGQSMDPCNLNPEQVTILRAKIRGLKNEIICQVSIVKNA